MVVYVLVEITEDENIMGDIYRKERRNVKVSTNENDIIKFIKEETKKGLIKVENYNISCADILPTIVFEKGDEFETTYVSYKIEKYEID